MVHAFALMASMMMEYRLYVKLVFLHVNGVMGELLVIV